MNDQSTPTTADPSGASPTDPVAALDELIAKAKAKRASIAQQSGVATPQPPGDVVSEEPQQEELPAGPTAEGLQAKKLAELAAKEAEQAEINQRMLQEQQLKMHDLEATPQYQARKSQDEELAKQQEEQKASQQGHVIHQISDAKV